MQKRLIDRIIKPLVFCALTLFFSTFLGENKVYANHLVGGELTYECLGGNDYRINLIIYRDCYSSGAPFDAVAAIYLRDPGTGDYLPNPLDPSLFRIPVELAPEDTIRLPINDEGLCTDFIPDVCVSRGEYSLDISLAPRAGGYEVVYQRCCRNTTILNINNPGETGSTYTVLIPHEDNTCNNSSPTFNNFPPLVICDGFPILFDHAATDVDGDSLVYSLCVPSDGAATTCPGNPLFDEFTGAYIAPNLCDSPTGDIEDVIPSPIGMVNWWPGFDVNNQLGNPDDPLTIDPVTGLLTGIPNGIGQYVVGICVSEYRNGVLIATKIRDFQFNVTDCEKTIALPDADAEEIQPGIFQITNCDDFTVGFDNVSVNATSYDWDFGIDGITTDISTEQFPFYTFPDTGTYEIRLVASNGTSCIDTGVLFLKLYPTFEAEFDFDNELCTHDGFQFQDATQTTYGVVDSWYWDFGDGLAIGPADGNIFGLPGTSGTFEQPVHYFAEPGTYNVTLVSTNDLGCEDTVEHSITVYPQPEANIDYDFLCLDIPTNFTASADLPNVVSYDWLFDGVISASGQTSQQLYNTPGDYFTSLIVETDQNCKDTVLFNFTIFPELNADAGLPDEMCFGDSIVLDASNSVGGAGLNINNYQWEPAEFVLDDPSLISPTVSPTGDQFFTLTVSDPNGCADNAQVFVTVFPLPAVDAGQDIPDICFGDSTIQLSGTVPASVIDFDWSPANVLSDETILSPFIYASDTTDFVLWGLDNNGCENRDTVNVIVIPPVNPMLEASDVTICEGDSIQLNASGGVQYIWEPPIGLSDPFIGNPVAFPTQDVSYVINIANPPCFEDSIGLSITVNPLPFVEAGPDATINIGETIQLNGMGDLIFEWMPGASLSDSTIADPIAMPLQTTVYTFTTETDQGCKAEDDLTITVTNIFEVILPNAFTPNGDGLNDFIGLRARGIEDLEQFAIFNRWGQKVFETNDINDQWDGTFKGKPQELGVYVFYVQARKFLGGEFFLKGNITLIR